MLPGLKNATTPVATKITPSSPCNSRQFVGRHREADGEWRVHFHVPVYLERFDLLGASQEAIRECLREAAAHGTTTHFEVETYAWGVLPPELRQPDLAAGIADEMRWFRAAWASASASG